MISKALEMLKKLEWTERAEVDFGHNDFVVVSRCPICKRMVDDTIIEIHDDPSKGAEYREYDGTLIGYRASKKLHKVHKDDCTMKSAIEELSNGHN